MASADIQAILDTQPPELPFQQPLVTATGLPTQHLINWNFYQSQWFKNNVIKADQRIDTVKATADNASAAVTTESNARAAADEALAEQITTVDAKANNATASGQVYFAAHAAPSGSLAAYGIYLTAGSSFTGLELLAMSDGTSAIGMTASSFVFTDSGTTKQVLTYYGGQFHFTSDVAIDGNLILNGTVVTASIADNAITHGAAVTGSSAGASLTLSARAGDLIFVDVCVQPIGAIASGSTTGLTTAAVTLNSTEATETIHVPQIWVYSGASGGDGSPIGSYYWSPATLSVVFTASFTGTQTIACGPIGGPSNCQIRIRALAISK